MLSLVLAFPGINDGFFKTNYVLQQIANGLSNGAIYALMAVTVVIIYRTTSQLNFAQGEMAMFATFVVYVLNVEKGINVWISMVVVAALAFIVGGLMERTLIRPISHRSELAPVIVTLGLFFIINALAATIWGTEPKEPFPTPFPNGLRDRWLIIDGVPKFFITYKAAGIWVTVGVLVVGLTFLLQKTKLGLAYRAVAANHESAQLVGIPVGRMLMLGWALSAAIGVFAGGLASQYLGHLDFNLMAGVLLYGFAAACLGGFDSLKGAVVGGIIVGLAESILPSLFSFIGTDLSLAVALLVILVVLMFKPEGLFGSKRVERV